MVVLLGIFLVMLIAMPVTAEMKFGDPDEDILTRGTDDGTFIPSGASADTIVAATGSREGGGIDTQSPVLDGSAYSNYDTIFVHGVNAEVDLPNSDVEYVAYEKEGLDISLFPKVSNTRKAVIYCPVPSYQLKTGGVQPRVKYIAVEYFSDYMTGGHAWPEVYKVDVYNGHTLSKTISTTFSSPIYSVQIIDLGNWYSFDRGMNIVLYIRSDIADPSGWSGFHLSGYAARFEW